MVAVTWNRRLANPLADGGCLSACGLEMVSKTLRTGDVDSATGLGKCAVGIGAEGGDRVYRLAVLELALLAGLAGLVFALLPGLIGLVFALFAHLPVLLFALLPSLL